MSQLYLAEKAGIDRAFLSLVENGKKEICLKNIELLALAMEISLGQMFSRV